MTISSIMVWCVLGNCDCALLYLHIWHSMIPTCYRGNEFDCGLWVLAVAYVPDDDSGTDVLFEAY